VLPSPGLTCDYSTSLPSLPESGLRRARSFDENMFQELDRTPFDAHDGLAVSPASERNHNNCIFSLTPQTPTLPDRRYMTETPQVGTASSGTFGGNMSIPKISIARSSDDVFGDGLTTERRNEIVVENGRVFERVREMESKLSHEDLARYGRKTAPGGVEWF
jgi:hypothetical protein